METSTYEELFDNADWWRAVPLSDRLSGAPLNTDLAHGRLRRQCWESGLMSGGRSISLERWEKAGISPDVLVGLLGESAASLSSRLAGQLGKRPEWLSFLEAAWIRYGDQPWPADTESPAETAPSSTTEPTRLADLVRPLLLWARTELMEAVAAVQPEPAVLPSTHPLFEPPTDQISRMLAPSVALEINVAREEGRLQTPGSPRAEHPEMAAVENGFATFFEQSRKPENALRFLLEYPVLAAEIFTTVRHWVQTRREFVERFLSDLPELCRTFGLEGHSLADLTEVRFGAGDSHRGGRSVAILGFADGQRLVYKPRRVDTDVCYNASLRWLNAAGLPLELTTLRILPRDGYGWVEFVRAAPCENHQQVERFFWLQDACLALFYALCGADLHHENVIAAGEHPVIVDVEALLQATPRMFGYADAEPLLSPAVKAARDSVLRVGLLPDHVIRTGDAGSYGADISGLTGGSGQLSMLPVLVLRGRGTDRMRMARERLPLGESANQARLRNEPVDLADYREQLIAGFVDCYRTMLRHRTELLAEDGPLNPFRAAPVRTLLRPTATYAKLLGESWHPDVLRDALDRKHLFESLSVALQGIEDTDPILDSEIRQLEAQDIPLFDTRADSADLYDSEGVVVPDFFEKTGLDSARDRIAGLSEADLNRQRWFVEASLTGLTVGEFQPPRHTTVELPDKPLDRGLAGQAAELIANQLLESAVDDKDGPPSWLSVAFVGDRYWRVAPTGADLYSGLAGIVLFLAELDAMTSTGSPHRYREPAVRIAAHLCDLTDYLADQGLLIPTLGGGGFIGLAGLGYVFTELGRLWDEPAFIDRAHRLVRDCIEACEADKLCDLLAGAAGTALAVAGIHRHAPSQETLDVLETAGRVLAARGIDFDDATAWPTDMETDQPLLGLSHGTSGIALALATIAEITGNAQHCDLAVRALRFERRHLSIEHGNWPDLRSFVAGAAYRNTWCHGASGIGLARAALGQISMPLPDDARQLIADDLEIAIGTVCRDLVRDGGYVGVGNDSLCHGDLGLVETLHAAASVLGRPELDLLGRQCARTVAERVLAGELRCGTPDGLGTPGLMLGIAGIGYGLLRAAAPEQVPNVLLLAPPDQL